jgi:hypothetical protein
MLPNKSCLFFAIVLVSLTIGIGRDVRAESLYHQPYLGLTPVTLLGSSRPLLGYQAEKILSDDLADLGRLTKSADLIFIGINGQLKKTELPDTQQVEYEADVRVYDLIKGKRTHGSLKFLHLRWKASATGIGAMERHLFFVREEVGTDGKKTYRVLRAAFMTPDSRNRIRLSGYSDRIHTDLVLKVL